MGNKRKVFYNWNNITQVKLLMHSHILCEKIVIFYEYFSSIAERRHSLLILNKYKSYHVCVIET